MASMAKIGKIRKRDGRIVDFDEEKITKAIWAATQAVGGKDRKLAEAVKRLLKKIAYNTRLPYITITPTFSICPEHGYLAGEHPRCPKCGENAEVYSRVVGYFKPVKNWNEGKQEEFRQRVEYKEKLALEKEFAGGV